MASRAEIEIILSNGSAAGKTINELTAQSTKLAREIKKLEVGSEAWTTASEDFKKISGRLKDVRKEAFDTAQAQNELNSMFADMVPYQAEFQKLSIGVKGVGAAFRATSSMAQLLKVALASTGIGLIVVALGSLVAWLSKTQKGMDFVQKVTKSLGAAFNVVIERLATFAEGMGQLLTGDFTGAWDSLKKSVSGFGTELAKETKATWENTGAMQALNREQKLLEVNKAKARAEIEKLKKAAEDQTKSETERLAAAQKAYTMEQSFLDQSIALQERKIKLIESENSKKGITLTDEMKQAQYDAEIELANLQEESFTRQTELQNKVNELKKSGVDQSMALNKKAHDEEIKQSEERKKALEAEQAARDKFIQESIAAEIKANEEQKKLDEDLLTGFKAQQQQEFDTRMQSLVTMAEAEQNMIDQLFFEGQIKEEERNQMMYEAQKKALEDRLALLMANGQQSSAAYQELFMQLLQMNHEHEEAKTRTTEENEKKRKELMQQGLSAAAGIFAGLATLLSQNAKARKKNFAVLKAVQAAEVAANTVTEISNIFKGYSALGPFGQALAIIQAAVAAARGASAISRINSTQIESAGGESFADGGPVFGKSHRDGGIPFLAGGQRHEMEGGEIILSKGVYQDPALRSAASVINQLGGGRSFALGGPVSAPVRSGFTATSTSPASSTAGNALVDTRNMEALQEEQVQLLRVIAAKPVLALTDIKDGLETLYDVENDATF